MKKLLATFTVLAVLVAAPMVKAESAKNDLLVTATVKVVPGTEAAFRAAGLEILALTRQEPGNKGYDLYQSPGDPTEFTTVEHWRSQVDIDLHMKMPYMQKFFATVGSMFQTGFPVLTTYQNVEKH